MVKDSEHPSPHLLAAQRYLHSMTAKISLCTCLAALVLALPSAALATSSSSPSPNTAASKRALLKSPELWATIDACSPTDQPDTVGIRGSMPGNGQAGETMYMRFRLQYLEPTSKHWIDLTTATTPNFAAVGGAKAARQAGRSFQLVPVPGKPAFMLRGVVSFQWRKGAKVVESVSRPTTAGHKSLAGADPTGFSAATCSIG
jgi:hypothetical protein